MPEREEELNSRYTHDIIPYRIWNNPDLESIAEYLLKLQLDHWL